ncbi:MAG: helix-turn-helix transcriptional regulator [Bacteroidales bacterium]|nr:helix-turn-helix transcriptional regulator [Bacteroidales bacterium]
MQNDIDDILGEIAAKDQQVLCREVLSIGDTMDVLHSKWTVEVLTAILCGNTRFKDILTAIHGLSDKVLTERLRQMVDDRLIEKHECRGYPPRVEYNLTDHGKRLYAIVYRMTEWGTEHRRLILNA